MRHWESWNPILSHVCTLRTLSIVIAMPAVFPTLCSSASYLDLTFMSVSFMTSGGWWEAFVFSEQLLFLTIGSIIFILLYTKFILSVRDGHVQYPGFRAGWVYWGHKLVKMSALCQMSTKVSRLFFCKDSQILQQNIWFISREYSTRKYQE